MLDKATELEKQLDWDGALIEYQKAAKLSPTDLKLLDKIGWCQSRACLYDDAIDTYKQLAIIEPQKAQWHYAIGYQYYMQEKWLDAIDWFRQALKLYPRYFKVKYRLAYALIRQSGALFRLTKPEFLEASKLLDECTRQWDAMSPVEKEKNKPTFADIYFQKGKIYTEKSEWPQAIECFKTALVLKPKSPDFQYQLAKALNADGQAAEAFKHLPTDNGKYYVRELIADIYACTGKEDNALNILHGELLRRKRDYIYRNIAEIYFEKKKDPSAAYNNIQKAISIKPQNHINHFFLAKIYDSVGLLLGAQKEADTAIELKKKIFAAEYHEAQEFLNLLMKKISDLNHQKDDEEILQRLVGINENVSVVTGFVKAYKIEKGYGFIEMSGESVFFHITDIARKDQFSIRPGVKVMFRIEQATKGPIAKSISLTE